MLSKPREIISYILIVINGRVRFPQDSKNPPATDCYKPWLTVFVHPYKPFNPFHPPRASTGLSDRADWVGRSFFVQPYGEYIYVEWFWYGWWIHICWLIVILLVNAYILSDGDVVGDCIYAKWMMMMWWWLLIELWLEVLKHVNSLRLLISSFISPKLKYINVWKTLIFYFLFFIFEGGKH